MVYLVYGKKERTAKMNKKALSLFLAAGLLVTATGCSGDNDVNIAPNGVDLTASVAYIENPPEDAGDRFNISYSEWHNEYLFSMAKDGYDELIDHAAADNYKKSVLDIQVQEHIVLYLAEQAGITAETLTQEELDEIEKNVQDTWDGWCRSYEAEAKEALGEGFTAEELHDKEFELFRAFMAESGLEPELFYVWETTSVIQDKFIEKTSESISDQTVRDFVQETIDTAKDMYENDIATFENAYTAFYVPEGARTVQQLFVKIDEDAANEIRAYRNDGDDEKADRLLAEATEPLRERIEEAYEKLSGGEEWSAVQEEYNEDANGNDVDYIVYPVSTYVTQDIIDAAMGIAEKGGFSDIITSDSGFFILYYKDDRVFSDEEMQSLMDQARDYLKDQESYRRVADFKEQYPYMYDYELMGITE